ncbi:MAG: response regulator [Nitrospiraceae bacterium]|nr:response regulator [Nitrospiraceae bacterium]
MSNQKMGGVRSGGRLEWRGHGTVLLVDDEPSIRDIWKRMLERVGFSVLTGAGGAEGVQLFGRHSAEIVAVVVDSVMPDMSGAEVFAQIQLVRKDVPVIVVSGDDEAEVRRGFGDALPSAILQKPSPFVLLAATLRELIERSP